MAPCAAGAARLGSGAGGRAAAAAAHLRGGRARRRVRKPLPAALGEDPVGDVGADRRRALAGKQPLALDERAACKGEGSCRVLAGIGTACPICYTPRLPLL